MSDEPNERDQRPHQILNYRGRPDPPSPSPHSETGGIPFKWGFGLAMGSAAFAAIAAFGNDGQGVACSLIGALVVGLMVGIFDLVHSRQGRFLLGFIVGEMIVAGIGLSLISVICGRK